MPVLAKQTGLRDRIFIPQKGPILFNQHLSFSFKHQLFRRAFIACFCFVQCFMETTGSFMTMCWFNQWFVILFCIYLSAFVVHQFARSMSRSVMKKQVKEGEGMVGLLQLHFGFFHPIAQQYVLSYAPLLLLKGIYHYWTLWDLSKWRCFRRFVHMHQLHKVGV